MIHKTLDEIYIRGRSKGVKRLAVACAHDLETLKAVAQGRKEGVLNSILIGKTEIIKKLLTKIGEKERDYLLLEEGDPDRAAATAVQLVKDNQADFLMKGYLNTANMLRAVINKERGLGTGRIISHINIMELASYKKLLIITDVGIMLEPNLHQKKEIIENAVDVFRKMGYQKPKVAVLAAIEQVNPRMPETLDAAELMKMNQDGEIKNCLVEGPLSFDIAMSGEIAKRKKFASKVAGDADVLVVPNVVAGNLLAKGLGMFGNTQSVAFATGASVPVVVTSRGTNAVGKYNSILACLATI